MSYLNKKNKYLSQTMTTNNENINMDNVFPILNEENLEKMDAVRNKIKVKLNPKLNQNNQENKGLKLIDPNINKLKEENKIEKEESKLQSTGLDKKNINLFVNKRESDYLLLKYGEDSYFFNKILEKEVFKIPETFLQNHKITSSVRTKMIDWMIEVCSIINYVDETFFLSVNILDIFLQKTKKIYDNSDIHLIGMTSIFTASKFQEIYPQSLKVFSHRVGHDMFTLDQIKSMESQILTEIGMETLVSTSVYDFMKTYFYDFFYNNKIVIEKNCNMKIFKDIMNTAKYLTKLIVHYEYFYLYENSIKAIGCIITAIKLMGYYLKEKFEDKDRNVYNQWILFLIKQDGFDKKEIENLVSKIYLAFNHYQKSKSISRNLNKFMKLPFADYFMIREKKGEYILKLFNCVL